MISDMKRNLWTAALALTALAAATPATAQRCESVSDLAKARPMFSDYAVKEESIARPAPVVLSSSEARRFRSALREAAKAGPNFAGHYTIAGWGCGTSCLDWGIVDARTGKVTFDAKLRMLETMSDDWARYDALTKTYAASGANKEGFDLLLFRRDSSLLIMLGAPGEDEKRDGVTYLHWTGTRFEQVGFIEAFAICRPD
jgi:hypothetical protein